MNCTRIRKHLSLSIDGRLPPERQTALSEHLHNCPSCRAWYEQQQEISIFLSEPMEHSLSPFFAHRLQQHIRSERTNPQHSFPNLPGFRRLAYGTIMLLIFLLSVLTGLRFGSGAASPIEPDGVVAFNETLELDLFADLPNDSFGAVYTGLLQGGER